MKKNFFKATLAVAAIAAVGLGSYKAYGSYTAANMSENDLLLAENVLALSDCTGGMANKYCPIWNVTVEYGWGGPTVTCSTGGSWKCESGKCPHGK